MGAKVEDSNQEYQYSYPFVSPSGHEFTMYDTPGNQRLIIRHTSGSHIEFKADGTVFLKAVKDLHLNTSVASNETGTTNSEQTTIVVDNDLSIDVKGEFKLKAKRFDVEAGEAINMVAGTDMRLSGNNVIGKSTEQISLEGTKSIYFDTKEIRERVVSRISDAGTQEPGAAGGQQVLNVNGNAIIRNNDPNGGITIQSAGYLNLVCGAERVDVTGDPGLAGQGAGLSKAMGNVSYIPSLNGRATYTHIVRPNSGTSPRGIRGSAYFEVGPGGYTEKIIGPTYRSQIGISDHNFTGLFKETYDGTKNKNVSGGEFVNIKGSYIVKARAIFLN